VRARAYLTHAQTEKGEDPDPDLRELTFKKNNYGPVAERILLRWERGVFVPEAGGSSLEKLAADQRVDDRFLHCLPSSNSKGAISAISKTRTSMHPKCLRRIKSPDGKRV